METTERETFQVKGTRGKPEPVKASKVLNAIAEGQNINVEYAVIKGDLDITPGIGSIANRLEKDEKGNLIIQGDVLIQYSEVKGRARFEGAAFSGKADFSGATFSGVVSFKKATFNGDAKFMGTTFSRYTHFLKATFSGNVTFHRATFGTCSGSSGMASLEKFANFDKATFSGKADFRGATFSGDVSFREATFEVNADFDDTKMKYPANFAGVVFRENTVFAGLWNYFLQPLFLCMFSPVLFPLEWLTKVKLPKWPVTDCSKFNTTTVMDGSSNSRLKRYIDDEQWILSWRASKWWRKAIFYIWELTSHCGRSLGLWVVWSVSIALLFGWLYSIHPEWFQQRMGFLSPWYFSVVTFTTLGFGDLTPKTECWQAQTWIMLEVVLGYFMLGGLISIFANKFARRS